MILLIVVLVLVVGGIVAVVTGRVGSDSMAEATQTSAFELPEGLLGARGVDSVRFDQALRGYNMGQVDAVLDRLFDEIASLERQVAGRVDDATEPASAGTNGEVADDAPRRPRHAAHDDRS